jgi:predicted metal-binding membrane protein
MRSASSLEIVLRRDRLVVTAGLIGVTVLSWAYTIFLASRMSGLTLFGVELAMPHVHSWQASYWILVFSMWTVMMVAMMVPSASPLILLFARMNRTRQKESDPLSPAAALTAGYILVWTAYSGVATLAQWGLSHAAILSPTAMSASPFFGGALLLAAGVFQWTPLKQACLTQCRSPLGFLMSEWREGTGGAVIMGIKHGWFCVGCCWVLMALLFVAGVMNLLWMAVITAFILAEKLLPKGELVARLGGVVLVASGILILVRS